MRVMIKAFISRALISAGVVVSIAVFVLSTWLKDGSAYKYIMAQVNRAVYGAQESAGLMVRDIVIVGRNKADIDDIKAAIGKDIKGSPIMSLDLVSIRERVQNINWIREAAVVRRLPDTVRIEIVERKPIAIWQDAGELSLIDKDGVVITNDNIGDYSELPIVIGYNAPEKAYDIMKLMATKPDLFNTVASLTLVGNRRWDVKFYNGVVVKLPEEESEAAWNYLAELEDSKSILKRNILTIDFRLKDRVFIGMPEGIFTNPSSVKSGEAT